MYSIKLDENNFFSGTYAEVGTVEGGVEIATLPPSEDHNEALCYQLVNDNWVFNEDKYKALMSDLLQYDIIDKILEINEVCEQSIFDGMDVVLSDGISHHFSLTLQDQRNIDAAYFRVSTGEVTEYPYHADGEQFKLFQKVDLETISREKERFILQKRILCNFINTYIKSCTSLEQISKVIFMVSILPVDKQEEYNTFIANI